jgi:hypothetical protein
MPRLHLPLLPLPVLAAAVAFAACSSRPGEPTTRVIPEAVAVAPATLAQPPAPAPPTGDDAPSDEEVRAFERPVAK